MIELSSKELDGLKSSIDIKNIAKNEAYYKGKNIVILNEKKKRKPDNKIPVALGYRLVSNLSGYAARTGDIFINQVPKGKDKEDTDGTPFELSRKEIDEQNNGLLLNSLLYIETLKQGISYDVVWTEGDDKKLDIKYAQIPNYQAVPVWNKELETVKTMSHFIRFWDDEVTAGSTEAQRLGNINVSDGKSVKVSYAQVFEIGGYQIYIKVGKGKWTKHEEFVAQPFKGIQVSAYRASSAAASYIEPVMVLLDQMDKLVSRNMNEVERFNNSILGVLKNISPEVKSKIDEMGVIDNLISGLEENSAANLFPKFIERNIPKDHAQMMIETIGRLVYEIMGSPNFSSESFGTASGIALLYRLIGLEYSASEIDIWYDQGLKNRDKLINEALRVKENNESLGEGFVPVIVHNRNLPVDVGFLAKSALDLKAIGVSMETILNLFPKSVVPDVKKEIERIEANTPNPAAELIPPTDDDE
jgi:SPP1 family phage portal protein